MIDTVDPVNVETIATVSPTESSINVGWYVSSDIHFLNYELYYDTDSLVTITDPVWDDSDDPALGEAGTTFVVTTVTGLLPGTTYYFRVRAVDEAENYSDLSPLAFHTTLSNSEPSAPENVIVTIVGDDVVLAWDEVIQDTESNPIIVSQYKIYSSDSPYFEIGAGTLNGISDTSSYTNTDAAAYAERVFYKVTAIAGTVVTATPYYNIKSALKNQLRKSDN
jgi:chitodextrinase